MILTKIYNQNEVDQTAQILYDLLSSYKIITFTGDLGAGKTTLVASLLKICEVKEMVQSPTFSYVNIYTNDKYQTFYHFDLYRISCLEDFYSLGFEEYFSMPNSWIFIEWPAIIMPLLTHNSCHATIDYEGENKRKIVVV